MITPPPVDTTTCVHCGDKCTNIEWFENKSFCCTGCVTVFQILNDHRLGDYYKHGDKPGIRPKNLSSTSYDFLESEEVVENLLDFQDGKHQRVTLGLPQIHCASCVWLLENLHKLNPGVLSSEVNFSRKQARIAYDSSLINLRELAFLLERIGYSPNFEKLDSSNNLRRQNDLLFRLAVAGFCFGNIMLLTFPEYLITERSQLDEFRPFFSWLIGALSVPILLYSAVPFFKSAITGIRSSAINLDVPISLGIVVLYLRSLFDIVNGHGPGYMDSFAGFVFLLLIGRWFQNLTYQSLTFDRHQSSYLPLAVHRLEDDGESQITPIHRLKAGDIVSIRDQEIIPADAYLTSEAAQIDYSFVTGEERLIQKSAGDLIYAGGKIIGSPARLTLKSAVDESYLSDLWKKDNSDGAEKGQLSTRVDNLSRYFLKILLVVVTVVATIWAFIDLGRVPEIVTATLIVACPCALALSPSFIYGYMQRHFGRRQFYLKNAASIETLARIDTVIFDKTGTLSSPNDMILEWVGAELSQAELAALKSLSGNSNQPLSRLINQSISSSENPPLKSFENHPGMGIRAEIEGDLYTLGSAAFVGLPAANRTSVFVMINGEIKGHFAFDHQYRNGLSALISGLDGYETHVLSGDNPSEKANLRRWFAEENMKFAQDPIDKQAFITSLQNQRKQVLMLGDGLNDIGAIGAASIGVAVVDDIHAFAPSCDGLLKGEQLHQLPAFLRMSKSTLNALKGALVFSIAYNLVGLGFAASGSLTPLVAAVLMPLSSISVVAYAWVTTQFIGKHSRKQN